MWLDQDVDRIAILINGSPKVLLLALDLNEDLIEKPRVAKASLLLPQLPGIFKPELPAPVPNRLVGYNHSSLSEQIFDIPQAQAEAVVEPDGVADDLAGKTMARVGEFRLIHGPILPRRPAT